MAELLIRLHSHHFVVSKVTPRAMPAVLGFTKQFVQPLRTKPSPYSTKPPPKPPVYATHCADTGEYRYHINVLKKFKEYLAFHNLKDSLVEIEQTELPPVREVDFKIFDSWNLHDYQDEGVDYVLNPEGSVSKLIEFQTGKGKGVTSLFAVAKTRLAPVIIVKPMYLEKWRDEIREVFDIAIEDLMIIRGSDHLMALLEMALEGRLVSKIVLISNKTIQNWFKLYKEYGDQTLEMGYACRPSELMQTLRSGFRLIDEVHQDFHLNFLVDLYTHCHKSLSLSATLDKEDPFIQRMYEIAYPSNERHKGPAYDRYTNATALFYRIARPDAIRTKDMQGNYSNHVFEKYLMKNPPVLKNYLNLIDQVLKAKYLRTYQPTEKAIIFCASIEFCTLVTEFMQKQYPNLDVRRYVEEDPFENCIEADIRVTTPISAGTAVDIPNLTTNIMSVAISSQQQILQMFGRTRKLKSGKTPECISFYCGDVEKHMAYQQKNQELLRTRALTYSPVVIPNAL
jgi:superfamily II DNA or RNA helicase